MKKKEIKVMDYANEILQALPKGVLVVTEAEDCVNAMVIGWGTLGVEWSREMFTIYIREGRFTRELLDRNPEFTVCIPYGKEIDKKVLGICGGKSGRTTDKIAAAKLTLVDGEAVSTSAIKELPLTLECKVVWQQKQEIGAIADRFHGMYPQDVGSEATGANKDAHIAYYGEIVKAYILEE